MVNSLELNSIFTTESISPISIIRQRNFAPNKSQNNIFDEYDDVVFLFENIPNYPNVGNDESFAFKSILKLDLDERGLKSIGGGIWITNKTIQLTYINLKGVFIYDDFFCDMGEGVGMNKVKSALERNKNSKVRFTSLIQNANVLTSKTIDYIIPSVDEISKYCNELEAPKQEVDSILNSLKGAFYSILAGKLGQKSQDEIHLLGFFEKIKNEFAIIRNRQDRKVISQKILALKNTIKKGQSLYRKALGLHQEIDYSNYEKDFLEEIGASKKSIRKAYSYLDGKVEKRYKEALNVFILERNPSRANDLYFDQLYSLAEEYLRTDSRKLKDSLIDDFDEILLSLKNYTKDTLLKQDRRGKGSIEDIELKKDFSVSIKGFKLKKQEQLLLDVICSFILKWRGVQCIKLPSDFSLDYFRHEVDFIVQIGTKVFEKENNTAFKDAFSDIFRFLKNPKYNYEITKYAEFPVQQNLAAFIIKPNKLSELQSFLESKKIRKKRLAYLFWGLFNGFNNLSQEILKPLSDNFEILNKIDNILLSYKYIINDNIKFSLEYNSEDFSSSSTSLKDHSQDIGENKYYVAFENTFLSLIDECDRNSDKSIKQYIRGRKDNLYKLVLEYKESVSPINVKSICDKVLKEASIRRNSKAYKLVVKKHIDSLIQEIGQKSQ